MATLSENRKAGFLYNILEKFQAGIELKGFEVKSVKAGRMNIAGCFGVLKGGEIWLVGADIPTYQAGNTPEGYDPKRSRRLLLSRKEINELTGKMKERGLTLVPLRVYNKGNLVKVELGLSRGN